MKRKLHAGSVNVTEPLFVLDSTSSSGGGLALVYNTPGLVAEYRREGQNAWTPITLSAGTLGTPAASATVGKIISDGALVGAHELAWPDNMFAAGATWCEARLRGATNMVPVLMFYELDAVNYQDPAAFGLTDVPADVRRWIGAVPNALVSGAVPATVPGALALPAGQAQAGSTIGLVLVANSNFAAGAVFVGQRLLNLRNGETRFIAAQSVAGTPPVYTFTMGVGDGENGPFGSPPIVSPVPDVMAVTP
jgi:hypothetical protein